MATLTSDSHPGDHAEKPTLSQVVRVAVHRLEDDLSSDNSARASRARADVSVLRRGVGRPLESNPRAWGIALERLGESFTEHLAGRSDQPSPYEVAAYDALTLFALHSQSAKTSMYEPQVSLGTAMGQLCSQGESGSLKKRFDSLLASQDNATFRYHLRSLITLLRSAGIGIDHGKLASDIATFISPTKRDAVRLRWSRDFAGAYHATLKKTKN